MSINQMKEQFQKINDISILEIKKETNSEVSVDLSKAIIIFKEKTTKDFDHYYALFYPKLVWMVQKMSIPQLDAEDIANQAFIRSLEKIDIYNPQYQYSTWVFDIAKKMAYQYKKWQHKMICVERISEDDVTIGEDLGGQSALKFYINAVTAVDDCEEKNVNERKLQIKYQKTLKAIALLKDKYKDIIKMCDVEGKSYIEISQETGLNMQTVKNRIHHGRLKIEEILKKEFELLELED